MADQTQPAQAGEETKDESNVPDNPHPVACLRVFLHKSPEEVEQVEYLISEGETTIGRGEDCDVTIAAHSLSRQHAKILVEDGSHFIQDLGSRNKTFRRIVALRPNMYYELTDGIELTFANVTCQYLITQPSDGGFDEEETQAYSVGNEEATKNEKEDDSDASTVCEEGGDPGDAGDPGVDGDPGDAGDPGVDGDPGEGEEDLEPTQAYNLGDPDSDQSECMEGAPMDCEHTLAYDVTGRVDNEEDNLSEPSSPPLVGGQTSKIVDSATGSKSEETSPTNQETSPTNQVQGGPSEPHTEEDVETDSDTEKLSQGQTTSEDKSEASGLKRTVTEYMDIEPPASAVVDPTVMYDLDTDVEDDDDITTANVKDDVKTTSTDVEAAKSDVKTTSNDVKDAKSDVKTTSSNVKDATSDVKTGEPEDSDSTDIESENDSTKDASLTPSKEDKDVTKGGQETGAGSDSDGGSKDEKEAVPQIIVEPAIPFITDSGKEDDQNKKDQSLLKLPHGKSALTEASLMDYSEQGTLLPLTSAGTVLLESYEESYEQTSSEDKKNLVTGTTVVLESYQSTCPSTVHLNEGETLLVKEDSPVANEEDDNGSEGPSVESNAEVEVKPKKSVSEDQNASSDDDLSTLIPSATNVSKQRTMFLSAVGGRGKRGGARKASRGRGHKNPMKPAKPIQTEDTEDLLNFGNDEKETKAMKKRTSSKSKKNGATLDDGPDTSLKQSVSTIKYQPTLESVVPMDVDVATLPAVENAPTVNSNTEEDSSRPKVKGQRSARRGRGRGGKTSRQTSTKSIKTETFSTSLPKEQSVYPMSVSHDLLDESPDLPVDTSLDDTTQPVAASVQSSGGTVSMSSSQSVRGKRGRGRGKRVSTSRRGKSTVKAEMMPSVRSRRSTTSTSNSVEGESVSGKGVSGEGVSGDKPRVMFTGLIDEKGQKTIHDLGGELVESVYQCTHLVTDKVRRTVKFLCCLSQGCLIVNDNWLGECAQAGHFLSADPFLIKDRTSERQHNFSLSKSHESAKLCKLLADYKVYLTPNIKPQRDQMADIIKCSGGEPVDFLSPVPAGDKVIIVTCEDDLSMCREAAEAGVPICSTELVLGGVLRQELDLKSHELSIPDESSKGGGRKRRAKESSLMPSAKRKRK